MDPTNGVAKVIASAGSPSILEILAVPEVLPVASQPSLQYDLPNIFQNRKEYWNSQIYIAIQSPMSSRSIHVNNKW